MRPAAEPYLVRFTYLLLDLSEISDDELRNGAMRTALAKLLAMCFEHARTGADFRHTTEMKRFLEEWDAICKALLEGECGHTASRNGSSLLPAHNAPTGA